MNYSFLKEDKKIDYKFLKPEKTNDYSFLNRDYNPDKVEKADNYRKVTLPLALGGGEYMTNDKGDLYMSPRSQDAIGGALPGKERDHIIPVSLGGTSNLKNLQMLESKPSLWQKAKGIFGDKPTVQESPERQEGKVSDERKVWGQYSQGEISLPQARLKIATKQQQIQGLTPTEKEQTVAGQFFPALQEESKNLLKVPGNMAKDAATAIVGSLDFLHRTGLHVVSGVGMLTSPTVVSSAKLLGDEDLKNISYDEIWKDAIDAGTQRAIDIGRPDEYFKSQVTGDTYVPNKLLLDEAQKLAKKANKNLEDGDNWEATKNMATIGAIGFMRDWANPFYIPVIKGITRNPYKPRGKVLWKKELRPSKTISGKAPKVKPQTAVLDIKTEKQNIFNILGDKAKAIKEPNVKIWVKMDKNGKVTADVRNLGGDLLNKNLIKQVGDIKPGTNTPILSLPASVRARIFPPTKITSTAVKSIKPVKQPLTTLQKVAVKPQEATIEGQIKKAKKYKITVNIKDKNDLEYLGRILSEEQIKDIKAGKMVNFRGIPYEDLAKVNLISKTPKTIEQKLAGKIKDIKLKSDTFYHGTTAENAKKIMTSGFKKGSQLPEDASRGGGYGRIQDSISFTETPKDASRFSTLSKGGEIVEVKLKPNSRVISIKGIEDANDLEEFLPYLKKKNIDAVYIGGGEKELVVINEKSITPTKSQLTDIWKKEQEAPKQVSTKNEQAFSRHYERVKEQYGFTDSVDFTVKTEKTEKNKAFNYIQRNPNKALRAGYDLEKTPKNINQQVFRAALVASLQSQGKNVLAQEVAKIQSLKMTEAAQTLAFGRVDIGEEAKIVSNITKKRLEKLGKQLGEKKPEEQVEVARKRVETKAKEKAKEVGKNQKQTKEKALAEIDDLINDIIC